MKSFLLIFFLFCQCLFAEDKEKIDVECSKQELHDEQENFFLTASYKIVPNVNPVTGESLEEEVDLVVAGSEPISVRRFYNCFAPYDSRYGSWRFNPEHSLVANFEWNRQERFASIGERNGNALYLENSDYLKYTFNAERQKSFTHFQPSGQTHPLNTKLAYWKIYDPKNKDRFAWHGTVIDGSGSKKTFISPIHSWLKNIVHKTSKGGFGWGVEYEDSYSPNVWTPYQLHVAEEKLANGNVIVYSYLPIREDKGFPRPIFLQTITAYNSTKTKILGTLQFFYPGIEKGKITGIAVEGSDKRKATFAFFGTYPSIACAVSPEHPQIAYGYNGFALCRIEKPDGRILTTEYDATGKVSAQYAPLGQDGEICLLARYAYSPNSTEMWDAEGNKIVYRFNEHKQILAVETYQDKNLYRLDRFTWNPSNGNLIKKSIEDGAGKILQYTEYLYDKNHNPIEEKISNDKEEYVVQRTFSDDGFNLKISESDRPGRVIRYAYLPNTNLLVSELTYDKDRICKRIFHTYNDCSVCIKTLIDDGSSTSPFDLRDVTYRKITEIQPRQSLPCFGLPEIVQEKTIDASGCEILLKKVVYSYTPFGKVLKEEHFDADGRHCYTLHYTYNQELLSSKTDPLGNSISLTYDANQNLISISGPRFDQHKEVVYDKANRPIEISEWQSDGSILISKKKYDKLGQVISEIDCCGNVRCFKYDALGRIIAIHHPDGAIERKEYDILGNPLKETDALGFSTLKTYNLRGQPLSIHYPDGSEEHFTYHECGTLASHIDKNGAKTVYTYDIFEHPISVKTYAPSGELLKATTAHYSSFHKISETDGEGVKTTYAYDFAGRMTAMSTDNKKTLYFYDALGRLEKTDHEFFHTIEKHDVANQLIEKRIEDSRGTIQYQEYYGYDEAGNQTKVRTSKGCFETVFNTDGKTLSEKNPLGFETVHAYHYDKVRSATATNPLGIQLTRLYDVLDRETEMFKKNTNGEVIARTKNFYDISGNLIEQTHFIFQGSRPIKTITHHWDYGPMGRMERFVEAGERETRYLYNCKGQLQTLIKPSGKKLHYEYDSLGRLIRHFSSDFDCHYTYNRNDQILSVEDAVAKQKTIRLYNALCNIEEETLGNGLTLINTFDNQGRRTTFKLSDDSSIQYAYRGKYLLQVSRKGQTFVYAKRDLEGRIIKGELPEKLGEIDIERDALSRWKRTTSPFYSSTFPKDAYDPVGNLRTYQYEDFDGKMTCTYAYDELDQLISEKEHSYLFDSLHNRLKKDDLNWDVNNLCQLTQSGSTAYEYDLDGNLIYDGNWRYTYDTQDRLIAAANDNKCIEFTYDPFHRRLSKTILEKKKQPLKIHYIWDGEQEIGSVNSDGKVQELRILGEGLGAEIGAAVLYELQGKTYVPIHDHRGCVVALVDPKTKKSENYRYTAFGEELSSNKLSP